MPITEKRISELPSMIGLSPTEGYAGALFEISLGSPYVSYKVSIEDIAEWVRTQEFNRRLGMSTDLNYVVVNGGTANPGGLLINSPDAQATVYNTTAVTPSTQINAGGGPSSFLMTRWDVGASPGRIFFGKARGGSVGTHGAIAANDELGGFAFAGSDGTVFRHGATILAQATAVISALRTPARLSFLTSDGTANPAVRFSVEADGSLAMGSSFTTIFDNNRCVILRSVTLAGLSSITHAIGKLVHCSDAGGGNGILMSDGASWRKVQDTGTEIRNTDAAFTLTPISSAPIQIHTGTLTADRAVTLSTTNAYDGSRFRLARTGGGAFNLTVAHAGGTKNLATNAWAEFHYSSTSSSWQLTAAGTL